MTKRLPDFDEHLSEVLSNASEKKLFDAWDLPVRVSKALSERRAELGLTQKQLAERLKIPQQDVSKVENLSGGFPKLPTLQKIAIALGCQLKFELQPSEFPSKEIIVYLDTNAILDSEREWITFKIPEVEKRSPKIHMESFASGVCA